MIVTEAFSTQRKGGGELHREMGEVGRATNECNFHAEERRKRGSERDGSSWSGDQQRRNVPRMKPRRVGYILRIRFLILPFFFLKDNHSSSRFRNNG